MSIEAMKQALEALVEGAEGTRPLGVVTLEAIIDLRQAIAEAEKQEPETWMNKHGACTSALFREVEAGAKDEYTQPLYTHPQPQREWVGLTDEERHEIREWQKIQEELGPVWAPMMLYLYEAIEAKLKEKNT